MRFVQIGLLAILIAGLAVTPAAAQSADSGVARVSDTDSGYIDGAGRIPGLYDETYIVGRGDIGDGRGYKDGYGSLSAFAPLYKFSDSEHIFTNSRLIFTVNSELAANVGLGWRRQFESVIVGGSLWFDTDESPNEARYNQFGAGVELLGENWSARANYYNPTAHGAHPVRTILGTTPFFRGHQIVFRDFLQQESPLTCADFEVGVVFPGAPWLSVYGGPYWYDSENRQSKWGGQVRVVAYVTDAASVQVAVSDDRLFGTNVFVALSYMIGPKTQPLRPFHKRTLDDRLYQQVVRSQRIASHRYKRTRDTPAINPVTGNPFYVIHVDPNGAAGDGTFESPFNAANFANSAQADIIRVLPGNFTSAGTIALFDYQRLLAANHQHVFTATQGTYVLPNQVAGANPMLSNLGGGNVVQLANFDEVSGFDVNGGGTGIGIVGSNINDFNLNRLNVTNATTGIRLTNFSQSGLTPPFGQPNEIRNVSVTGSTSHGVQLLQNNGGTGIVAIDNLTATNNGGDGLLMDISAAGTFMATVTNSTLTGNGRNAIRAVLTGGSTGTINAADITATGSGEHGVFLSATDSTLSSTLTRVDASDSGQAMSMGLADAFNIDVTNSTASVSIVDSTGINTMGNTTQENGLRTIADMGSSLTTVVSGSNFSGNTISAIYSQVRDTGTNSSLTVSNTLGDNSGIDGFFYDVTEGAFTAVVTGSSFNGSGRNAIRAIGGTSPAVMNVTFDSTTANNSGAEGVFFSIFGGGGASTFNFTYLPTSPSAILNSGGANGVTALFDGAGTTGTVNFGGIVIDSGINAANQNGATVNVIP